MLFAGREVRMVKNCDRGQHFQAQGHSLFLRCEISCEVWSFTTKTISVRRCMLLKSIESNFFKLKSRLSEKIRYVYSREILLNTATIRGVNSTEIDSNFTARETQDCAPLQRQATTNQTNFHNFKTRNWIYLQWLFPCHFKVNRDKLALTNRRWMCKRQTIDDYR